MVNAFINYCFLVRQGVRQALSRACALPRLSDRQHCYIRNPHLEGYWALGVVPTEKENDLLDDGDRFTGVLRKLSSSEAQQPSLNRAAMSAAPTPPLLLETLSLPQPLLVVTILWNRAFPSLVVLWKAARAGDGITRKFQVILPILLLIGVTLSIVPVLLLLLETNTTVGTFRATAAKKANGNGFFNFAGGLVLLFYHSLRLKRRIPGLLLVRSC